MRAIFIILCGTIVFFLTDLIVNKKYPQSGVVVGKSYSPMQVGTGVGTSSNGKAVVVTTVTPEQYIVIVKNENGVFSCEATAKGWEEAANGNFIHFDLHKGFFTGICWQRTLED